MSRLLLKFEVCTWLHHVTKPSPLSHTHPKAKLMWFFETKKFKHLELSIYLKIKFKPQT
jgi:hypothetical protein